MESITVSAEVLIAQNQYVDDCHVKWMKKFGHCVVEEEDGSCEDEESEEDSEDGEERNRNSKSRRKNKKRITRRL